jgi:hypothetical protein
LLMPTRTCVFSTNSLTPAQLPNSLIIRSSALKLNHQTHSPKMILPTESRTADHTDHTDHTKATMAIGAVFDIQDCNHVRVSVFRESMQGHGQ